MQLQIITLYCLCDDFLKARNHRDAPHARMTTAEVLTVAFVASAFFHNNQETSRVFLQTHGYIPQMLSKSRLNRRLHALPDSLWQDLWVALTHSPTNPPATYEQRVPMAPATYLVDSFPLLVCDNLRISRSRLYHNPAYRGYCASKQRYFFGLKIHLHSTFALQIRLTRHDGRPVSLLLSPGRTSDVSAFRFLPLPIAQGSHIYADAGYTDYTEEDRLAADAGLTLIALRKHNSKRPHDDKTQKQCRYLRKRIETTFSQIARWFGKGLQAVTAKGLERKVFVTVLAYAMLKT